MKDLAALACGEIRSDALYNLILRRCAERGQHPVNRVKTKIGEDETASGGQTLLNKLCAKSAACPGDQYGSIFQGGHKSHSIVCVACQSFRQRLSEQSQS
jgi:hypothetical protein